MVDDTAKKAARAKGNKNLKPFKKGQSGNPGGRQKTDPIVAAIKRLTSSELAEMGSLIIKGNREDIKKIAEDPNATLLQLAVAKVIHKAIDKGDMHSLDLLLNRLIGKVKDHHDFSGIPANNPAVTQVVIAIPSNGREKK